VEDAETMDKIASGDRSGHQAQSGESTDDLTRYHSALSQTTLP
jgi:hypothetical protein